MTRALTPLYIADLSEFSKTLRRSLRDHETPADIGHAEFMGLVAKSAGFRNLQHLKSQPATETLTPAAEKALRVFDDQGRMTRWPAQTNIQGLCLWAFWARLPGRQDLSEKDVNTILKAGCLFGDHVLMRRSLIDHKLVTRSTDGRIYRRLEQKPSDEVRGFLRHIAGRGLPAPTAA